MHQLWYSLLILTIRFSTQELAVMEGVQGTGAVKSNSSIWKQQWGKPWSWVTPGDISGSCLVSGRGYCWSLRFGSFCPVAALPSVFTESPQFVLISCLYSVFQESQPSQISSFFSFYFLLYFKSVSGRLWQACQGHLHLKWKMNRVLIPAVFCLPWREGEKSVSQVFGMFIMWILFTFWCVFMNQKKRKSLFPFLAGVSSLKNMLFKGLPWWSSG